MKIKTNWRWAVVALVGGLGVVSACSSDDDDAPPKGTAGKSNTAGSSGSGGGPKAGAPGKGDGGGGAGPGTTDGGVGGVKPGGEGGATDCNSFKNTKDCYAHGCTAETGWLSELLGGDGGAGGAAGGDGGTSAGGVDGAACSRTEDVFISCEDGGAGGAIAYSRCDASCTRCMDGGYTLARSTEFVRSDCSFTCVDGVAQTED